MLLAAAVLVRLAEAVAIPYPIALVVGGVAIGVIPGLPDIELEPDTVFLVFLPPLVHAAGFYASPLQLRAAGAQLVWLTVGLVLVTMGVVAVVAHEAIGLSWAAAFVLGAIVGPTDPVTAGATFSRLGVPKRVSLAVEGEAMLNDATAIVAYRIAVAAVVSGTFQAGDAAVDFVLSVAGGVAVGLAVGWLGERAQRRLADPPLAIFLSVLFAYAAYVGAEELGVSGVLATVTAGVWFGWRAHAMFDPDTRLSAIAFWHALEFALNATLFVLLGLQLEAIVAGVEAEAATGTLIGYAALVSAAVVGVRITWQFLPPLLARVIAPARRVDTGADWRERLIVGWSGMRGAISLAAALALPVTLDSGTPLPERDLLIFLTLGVIVVTLVGQGLTLPALIRLLGIEGDRAWTPDEAIARLEAAQAALDHLDELEEAGVAPEERLRVLRELYRERFRRCMAVIAGEGDRPEHVEEPLSYSVLRRRLIEVERDTLQALRREGRLRPDVLRLIERDLDLEEAGLTPS